RSNHANSSSSSSDRSPPTYGYHNTFHTHVQPSLELAPPSYACANNEKTLRFLKEKALFEQQGCSLPPYSCSVELSGVLGLKQELCSPFQAATSREWNEAYVVLRGTQLLVYRVKTPHFLSKSRTPTPGRLVRTYTLQHAEAGVAADFKKTPLTPKSPFAHLVPANARQKLYDTDPHLFEPVREHVLRLRLETEQFLLCAATQDEMLTWIEKLCTAIDISPPLEDRSEPRYRSLPRRTRRQRQLDQEAAAFQLDYLDSHELGRRLLAEQEHIFRHLYPHLCADTATEQAHPSNDHTSANTASADPDAHDYDPEDVRFPSARRTTSRSTESEQRPASSATANSSADPKSRTAEPQTPAQILRFRKRCAPVLLASSPRVSDVVFTHGQRMRINVKEHILVDYEFLPPRYDAHNFPKQKKKRTTPTRDSRPAAAKSAPAAITVTSERPASPVRGISDDSFVSFGYELD
ncbi:hypothetical protein K491DRAFT_574229, partial [Lophiostoma macrostomum CBS 122681]